ncbi:Crp/Fnr family transcriptional regulator [Rhodobacteraceae bacterium WD3A24]|nr:Crp/Fnr family transcriptional regulator [Rhodobacteraceae bacterium WD3A24]
MTEPKSDVPAHGPARRRVVPAIALESGLTEQEQARLSAIGRVQRYAKGATILDAEGEPAMLASVLDGFVKLQKTRLDGRRQIVGLLVPGEMIGQVYGARPDFESEAATDVMLRTFDRRRFRTLLDDIPRLEHNVLASLLHEFEAAREWMMLVSGHSVTERFAGFLLLLCRRWPESCCSVSADGRNAMVRLPVSRADLAQYLGTTVESISRAVQQHVRDGVLGMRSASQFEVLDFPELIARSGHEAPPPA